MIRARSAGVSITRAYIYYVTQLGARTQNGICVSHAKDQGLYGPQSSATLGFFLMEFSGSACLYDSSIGLKPYPPGETLVQYFQ